MTILALQLDEDCFDTSVTATITTDAPWTREVIERLAALGDLEYFPDFPRPFFRLRAASGWQLKGVEDETTCRLISAAGPDLPREELVRCLGASSVA